MTMLTAPRRNNETPTPAPPINQRPSGPLGQVARGNGVGVVSSVDSTGKWATILVNNQIPGEAGYFLPAGTGPWVQGCLAGPTTLASSVAAGARSLTLASITGNSPTPNGGTAAPYSIGDYFYLDYGTSLEEIVIISLITTNVITTLTPLQHAHLAGCDIEPSTKGFHYYFDNPAGDGGSFVTADLDLKRVLNVSTQVSTAAPTPYYAAISTHTHSGAFNPQTGIIDPEPITVGGLAPNPGINTPTPTGITLVGGGPLWQTATTLALEFSFSLPGGTPDWLYAIRAFAVPASPPPTLARIVSTDWGDFAPQASGNYQIIWDGLTTGVSYNLYIGYLDLRGHIQSVQPIQLGTANFFLGVGSAHYPNYPGTFTAPAFGNAGTRIYSGIGGGAFAFTFNFTLNNNWSGVVPTWCAAIRVSAVQIYPNPPNTWPNASVTRDLEPLGNEIYTATLNLAGGGQYNIYITFIDQFDAESLPTGPFGPTVLQPVLSTATYASINNLPPGTPPPTPQQFGSGITGISAGGGAGTNLQTNNSNAAIAPGGSVDVYAEIFVRDPVSTNPNPPWLSEIELVYSIGNIGLWSVGGELTPNNVGSYTATWQGLGIGNEYVLGCRFIDFGGNRSDINQLTTIDAFQMAAGGNAQWTGVAGGAGNPWPSYSDIGTHYPGNPAVLVTDPTFAAAPIQANADVQISFAVDGYGINQTGGFTSGNGWLAEIELVAMTVDSSVLNVVTGGPPNPNDAQWARVGAIAPQGSGYSNVPGNPSAPQGAAYYLGTWSGLAIGGEYSLGFRYIDMAGNKTQVAIFNNNGTDYLYIMPEFYTSGAISPGGSQAPSQISFNQDLGNVITLTGGNNLGGGTATSSYGTAGTQISNNTTLLAGTFVYSSAGYINNVYYITLPPGGEWTVVGTLSSLGTPVTMTTLSNTQVIGAAPGMYVAGLEIWPTVSAPPGSSSGGSPTGFYFGISMPGGSWPLGLSPVSPSWLEYNAITYSLFFLEGAGNTCVAPPTSSFAWHFSGKLAGGVTIWFPVSVGLSLSQTYVSNSQIGTGSGNFSVLAYRSSD